MFEAIIIMVLASVIGMQWYTIVTYKERFERIGRIIKKIQQTKEDKGHTHKSETPRLIQGDMDIIHKGQKASVKALIYPRKIK